MWKRTRSSKDLDILCGLDYSLGFSLYPKLVLELGPNSSIAPIECPGCFFLLLYDPHMLLYLNALSVNAPLLKKHQVKHVETFNSSTANIINIWLCYMLKSLLEVYFSWFSDSMKIHAVDRFLRGCLQGLHIHIGGMSRGGERPHHW